MKLRSNKGNILYWGLVALVAYMPLHFFICELLLRNTGIDNICRDFLIIALTGLVFFNKESFSDFLCILIGAVCVMLACFGILSFFWNGYMPILNILRTYLVPILIFFVCRSVPLTKERFQRLNTLLVTELAIIALYGYIQAFVLTDDFLLQIGYPSNNGQLAGYSYYIAHFFGYQRSVGTFVSPNICGIILAIAFCVLMFTDDRDNFRWKYILGTALVIGLIATFSRSAMLGVAVGTGLCMLLRKSWTRITKKTFRRALLVLLTIGAFLLMDQLIWDGLCRRMLLSTIFRTFTGEDPSANAHKEHLIAPPVATPPSQQTDSFSISFGMNGPMAEEFLPNPKKVESALYLMVYELGLGGAILYFLPYMLLVVRTILNRKRYPYFAPAAVNIAVLTSYVFLPNVQTFEVPFYCFMFMGLYCNHSVKKLYCKPEDIQEDITVKELLRTLLGCVKRIPLFFSLLMPRSKNIYIFGAWLGQKFSDNSRALYLHALKHSDKKCIWICNNKQVYDQLQKDGLPVLMAYSPKGIYYQLRAGVAFSCIGDGDFYRQLLGNCVHVELWHGVGGGKKIGLDDKLFRENALSFHGRVYERLEKFPMRKHYFVCTSDEMKQVFRTAFLIPEDHFIYAGQPRNDMFYQPSYESQTISREEFGGKKVIVYMPTHRKGGSVPMPMAELLDLEALNTFCQENNAVFLIKKHFYHRSEKESLEAYPNILDITDRPVDSNELLMVADYLISDYSSCTADYLLLDRPVFYYCYDYEAYTKEDRDLYWEFEDITPGPRAETFCALLGSLQQTIADGADTFAAERKRVRDMFYDPACQCAASEKILEQVASILK